MQLQFFFLHSIPTFEKMAYSGIEKWKTTENALCTSENIYLPFLLYLFPSLFRQEGWGGVLAVAFKQ